MRKYELLIEVADDQHIKITRTDDYSFLLSLDSCPKVDGEKHRWLYVYTWVECHGRGNQFVTSHWRHIRSELRMADGRDWEGLVQSCA